MHYQFSIKLSFEAMDDAEAREIVLSFKQEHPILFERKDIDSKLQRLNQNKPPEKVPV